MRVWHILFHLVCYYIAWFSCIVLAARGNSWLGPVIVILITIAQWRWQVYRQETQGMWLLVLLFTIFGFVLDSLLVLSHFITFNASPWVFPLSPPWMTAIWLNFAVVFYACLQSLMTRYVLLGVLSLVGFPLAFLAGVKMGAATLPYGNWSCILFGLIWAVVLPVLTYIYSKVTQRLHYV